MLIKSVRIKNYKGFRDSRDIYFVPDFNIIVGQNNAGKTALLESFRLWNCPPHPYRGLAVARHLSGYGPSEFSLTVLCGGSEIIQLLQKYGGDWSIPIPGNIGPNALGDVDRFLHKLFESESLEFSFVFQSGAFSENSGDPYPSHGLFTDADFGSRSAAQVHFDFQSQKYKINGVLQNHGADSLRALIGRDLLESLYVFNAERMALGTSSVEDPVNLAPNAANLPSCLLKLSGNTAKFDRFNDHVSEIFPSIRRVFVVPLNSQINIRLWSADPASERDDLLVRLEDSGTGVGQVLAILYVAMTKEGKVIAIDEPNSFLHPGAAKRLVEILATYSKNQYIISTHSTEIIRSLSQAKIIRVRRTPDESVVESYDQQDVELEREILADIGVSISDVFGVDYIIWVEGATEQFVFPLIAEHIDKRSSRSASFIALRNTGEIESRRYQGLGIWEIYERLSSGAAIIPRVVLFSLDQETRSAVDMADLQRRSKGRVKFLPRRCLENYFLNAGVIRKVLIDESRNFSTPLNTDYEQIIERQLSDQIDLKTCNAPKVIEKIFFDATDGRIHFSKTRHSVMLAKALIEFGGADLDEISQYVRSLISA